MVDREEKKEKKMKIKFREFKMNSPPYISLPRTKT